jgi:hypothetical protein
LRFRKPERNSSFAGTSMDWLPWRFARSFVRAFCPTLIVLLSWDLWRNLGHASAARPWAVTTDVLALGAVLALRLASPLAPALAQLQYFVPLSSDGLYRLLILLASLALDIITHSSFLDPWLLVAAYALSVDVSRVRKVPVENVDPRISLTFLAFGIAGAFLVRAALVLILVAQGTGQWRAFLRDSPGVLMMVALLALLMWWGQKRKWQQTDKRDPVVEDLEFNPNVVLGVAGVIGVFLLGTALLPKLTWQGTLRWRDVLGGAAALLTVVPLFALVFWWARERKPGPVLQELCPNQPPSDFGADVPGRFKPRRQNRGKHWIRWFS